MMKIEDLIVDLSSRATPVRPLAPPAIRFAGWLAVAVAFGLAALAGFGPRANLAEAISLPLFITTAVLTFGAAALSGVAALVLAIPGAERSPALRVSALMASVWPKSRCVTSSCR